jgi:hypothetical protein
VFGEVNGRQGNASVISGIHEVASSKQSNTLHVWGLNNSSADKMDTCEVDEQ